MASNLLLQLKATLPRHNGILLTVEGLWPFVLQFYLQLKAMHLQKILRKLMLCRLLKQLVAVVIAHQHSHVPYSSCTQLHIGRLREKLPIIAYEQQLSETLHSLYSNGL